MNFHSNRRHKLKLLAIDTSTEACSAALGIDGEVRFRYEFAPRRHAELILPMVDQLLAEAQLQLGQLDALAFGRGPGAFTGVRIATGVIQGLALAADLAVVPVSTLAALAQGAASDASRIISAIDARMGEIYWGCYLVSADGMVDPVGSEQISAPDTLTAPEGDVWYGVGSGWHSYHETLCQRLGAHQIGYDGERYPHARDIIPLATREYGLGKSVAAEAALPVYLRNKVTS